MIKAFTFVVIYCGYEIANIEADDIQTSDAADWDEEPRMVHISSSTLLELSLTVLEIQTFAELLAMWKSLVEKQSERRLCATGCVCYYLCATCVSGINCTAKSNVV